MKVFLKLKKGFTRIRHHGVSLRVVNNFLLVMAVVISAVLFVAMHLTTSMHEQMNEMTERLIEWQRDCYNVQSASDYLTENIRNFVITGEKKYLDQYFEEAKVTRRRDIALEKMEKLHGDSVAYRDLKEAIKGSVELMNKEYYAARLAVEAYSYDLEEYPEEVRNVVLDAEDLNAEPEEKRSRAEDILFGEDYGKDKTSISQNINNCINDLDQDLNYDQKEISKKLDMQVLIEHILTVLLIVVMLGTVILTFYLVIRPLEKCVELIREEKDIPINGAYEIQFLAKTYNLIHHTNLESKEKLTYEATHDKLTGLYNRRGYDFLIRNVEIESAALLLFDLDRFKQVNDENGHDVGDKVLIRASDAIYSSFRSQDYICRIGGDEIAVIMVKTDDSLEKLLKKKLQKLNGKLKNPQDGVPPISVSVGVAFGSDTITSEILFKHADNALYEAKNGGRSTICFYKGDD